MKPSKPPSIPGANWANVLYIFIIQGKAISVTGLGGPQGYETSRFSRFLENRLTVGEVVSFERRPGGLPLTPGKFLVFAYVTGWFDPRI
jgi:hypothetical protein